MKSFLSIFILSAGIFFIASHAHAAVISKAPNNLGLAGYWSFDDGNGTLAGDSSGNRNTGTTTATTWTTGKRGKALSFNGSSSIVDVASSTVFDMGSTLSLSSWFYINSWTNWAGIVGKSNVTEGVYVMQLSPTGNKLRFSYNSVTPWSVNVVDSTAVIPVGKWVHAVITYDGTNVRFYINGKLDSTTNIGAISFDACPACKVSMGQDPPGSNEFFNGKIDDVRIYSRALSATEIAAMFSSGQTTRKVVSNQGLVGYWSMNEGRGNSVGDSSGLGNSATLSGNMTWATGKRGKGLSLNGTAGSLQLASNTNTLLNNNQNTLAMWVYVVGTGPNTYTELYANAGGVTAGSTNFWLLGNSLIFNVNGILYTYTVSLTRTLNVWNHIAVTIDRQSNIGTVYLNGVYQGQVSLPSYTPAGSSPVIGSNRSTGNGGDYLNGSIDDVRIYNRILSAAEIQTLYRQNETKMNSSQNTRLTDGLVGLWSFNGQDYDPASTTAEVLDRSATGNNGDNVGASRTIGKVGQALNFDGTSNYVNLGSPSSLALSRFTISGWIKPTSVSGYFLIYGLANMPKFYINPSGKAILFDGSINAVASSTLSTNTWQHVVVTHDQLNTRFYLNGAGDGFTSNTTSYSTSASQVKIGQDPSGSSQNFPGAMDEVRVYNRALTADEVKQLYNMGK